MPSVARKLSVFLLITFVPGYLFQRHLFGDQNRVVQTLHSVGLSLLFLTIVTLSLNTISTVLLIERPITQEKVGIFLLLSTIVLNFRYPVRQEVSLPQINSTEIKWGLILSLIPIYAVLGAYLQNIYKINILLYLSLFAVAAMIAIYHKIPEKLYPFAIYCLALTLVFCFSLVTGYIRFGDANLEAFFAQQTIENGKWLADISRPKNSMLMVVLTEPAAALLLDVSIERLVRVYYPIWFAFSAVAVYQSTLKSGTKRVGFLSATVFISVYMFSEWLSQATRQGFAVLFFSLFIMTVATRIDTTNVSPRRYQILLAIYGFGMILSHYATALITGFGFFCISVWKMIDRKNKKELFPRVTPISTVLYGSLLFGWYLYTSNSYIISKFGSLSLFAIQNIIDKIALGFQSNRTSSESGGFLQVALGSSDQFTFFFVVLSLVGVILLIGVGGLVWVVRRLFGKKAADLSDERIGFSLGFVILMGFSVIVPELSRTITPDRIFIVGLVSFAPFTVLGAQNIKLLVQYLWPTNVLSHSSLTFDSPVSIFVIFLSIVLILNTGLFSAVVTHDYSPGIELQQEKILESGTEYEKINVLRRSLVQTDVVSSRWFVNYMNAKEPLYTAEGRGSGGIAPYPYGLPIDAWNFYVVSENVTGPVPELRQLTKQRLANPRSSDGYIYMGYLAQNEEIIVTSISRPIEWYNKSKIEPYLQNKEHQVYTNGNAVIFKR